MEIYLVTSRLLQIKHVVSFIYYFLKTIKTTSKYYMKMQRKANEWITGIDVSSSLPSSFSVHGIGKAIMEWVI